MNATIKQDPKHPEILCDYEDCTAPATKMIHAHGCFCDAPKHAPMRPTKVRKAPRGDE